MHIFVRHENRTWDGTVDDLHAVRAAGIGPSTVAHATLDLTLFDRDQHILGGWLPAGAVLGRVDNSDTWGPYDPHATDGRATARGILHSSVLARWPENGDYKTTATGLAYTSGAYVRPGTLPFNPTVHTAGGYLDDTAEQALTAAGFAFRHEPTHGATTSTSMPKAAATVRGDLAVGQHIGVSPI